MIITEVEMRHNTGSVFLRIPWKNGTYKGVTLERSWLPRGMATASHLTIEYDPASIRPYTENEARGGYTGEVTILDAHWRRNDQGSEEDSGVQGST